MLAHDYNRQIAASFQDRSQVAVALRIQVLR